MIVTITMTMLFISSRSSGASSGPRGLSPQPPPPNIFNSFPEQYDLQQRLNQQNVASYLEIQKIFNNLRNTDFVEPPSFFANNASTSNVDAPAKPSIFNRTSSITPQPNRFGSQT